MTSKLNSNQKQILLKTLKTTLLYTEHSGNSNTIYAFSLATGESTYSFGLAQFDVGKNTSVNGVHVQDFLRDELKFNQSDIAALRGNSAISKARMSELNDILSANKEKIDSYTDGYLNQKISKLDALIGEVAGARDDVAQSIISNPKLQLRIIDFDNQFGIGGVDGFSGTSDGAMISFLKGRVANLNGGAKQLDAVGGLSEANLQEFRSATKQAIEYPKDAIRRETDLQKAFTQIDFDNTPASSPTGISITDTPLDYTQLATDMLGNPTSGGLGATIAPSSGANTATTGNTNSNNPIAIQLHPNGQSATLANGQVIQAGAGGYLKLDNGQLTKASPAAGTAAEDPIFDVKVFSKTGAVVSSNQVQIIFDPANPTDIKSATLLLQGTEGKVLITNPDSTTTQMAAIYQVGFGWVDKGTGDVLQSVGEIKANKATGDETYSIDAQNGSDVGFTVGGSGDVQTSSNGFYEQLVAAFTQAQNAEPTNSSGGVLLASAGGGTWNDSGLQTGGGLGNIANTVNTPSAPAAGSVVSTTSAGAASTSAPAWLTKLEETSPDFAARLTLGQIDTISQSPTAVAQIEGFVAGGGTFVSHPSGGSDYIEASVGKPASIRIEANATGNEVLRLISHELGHHVSPPQSTDGSSAGQTWGQLRGEGEAVYNEFLWNRDLVEGRGGQVCSGGFSMSASSGSYQRIAGYLNGSTGDITDIRNAVVNQIAVNIANDTPSTDLSINYFNYNFEHYIQHDPKSPLAGATNVTKTIEDDGTLVYSGIKDGKAIAISQPRITSTAFSFDDDGNVLITGTRTDGSSVSFSASANGVPNGASVTTASGSAPLGVALELTFAQPTLTQQLSTTDLTPQQQTQLATQLTQAGLNPKDTQLIPLPSGGYLIANSEGELVGSTTP